VYPQRPRRIASYVIDRWTLRLLLIPQPVLTSLIVLGVRLRRIEPTYAPVLIVAALPLAAAIIALAGLRDTRYSPRRNWAVLAISLVELCWAVMALAIIGFAIALHSG
jgi:hypothetical protein